MNFKAIAFLSTDRLSGSISIASGRIIFSSPGQHPISLPLHKITLSRGGSGNKFIFITEANTPGITLATEERGILKALLNTGVPEVISQINGLKLRARYLSSLGTVILISVLAALALIWINRSDIALMTARAVPHSLEAKAGDALFKVIGAQLNIIKDEEVNQAFEKMVYPLVSVLNQGGFKPKLKIARSDELNAFALPGGYVVVNSATILKAESAEEVLGVMAHEFAHVSQRHVLRGLITAGGIYFVVDLFFGGMLGSLAALTELAPYLLQMRFSRDYEREADRIGFSYLIEANIDPMGMVRFFERVVAQQESIERQASKVLEIFSTHPDTPVRIEAIKEMVAKESPRKYINLEQEFQLLKEALKEG